MKKTWSSLNPKFSKSILARICIARLKGEKLVTIAKRYGIHPSYVSKLANCAKNCSGFRYRTLPKRLRLRMLESFKGKLMTKLERVNAEFSILSGGAA